MLRVHYGTVDANKERCFKSVCMRTIPSLQSQRPKSQERFILAQIRRLFNVKTTIMWQRKL